jgi:small-conductance mechanosensitive channel
MKRSTFIRALQIAAVAAVCPIALAQSPTPSASADPTAGSPAASPTPTLEQTSPTSRQAPTSAPSAIHLLTASPSDAPAETAEVRAAKRSSEELQEIASLADQELTEFNEKNEQPIKAFQQALSELKTQQARLPPKSTDTQQASILELRMQNAQLQLDIIEDKRELLRLRVDRAKHRVDVAKARADLKIDEAAIERTLEAATPEDADRARTQKTLAEENAKDLRNQLEVAKSEILTNEKEVTLVKTLSEERRQERDAAKDAVQTAKPGADSTRLNQRLKFLNGIVASVELRLGVIEDQLAVRRESADAILQATELSTKDLEFRTELAQKINDRVATIDAKIAADQAKSEQKVQSERSRQINEKRETLEAAKQKAIEALAVYAPLKEEETSAGPTRELIWNAQHNAASEQRETVDRHLKLLDAIAKLDQARTRLLEEKASVGAIVTAQEVSIRQMGRDIALIEEKHRAAVAESVSLKDAPEVAKKLAAKILQKMISSDDLSVVEPPSPPMKDAKQEQPESLEKDDKAQQSAAPKKKADQQSRYVQTVEVAFKAALESIRQIRDDLEPLEFSEEQLPLGPGKAKEEARIRSDTAEISADQLPDELDEADFDEIRSDFEALSLSSWNFRKRQVELEIARAAVLSATYDKSKEYADAMDTFAKKLGEQRARDLWIRTEAVVGFQTLRQAWSDLRNLRRYAVLGVETLPQRLIGYGFLRALGGAAFLAIACFIGWRVGLVVKKWIRDAMRTVRGDRPNSMATKAHFVLLRTIGESQRFFWLAVAVISTLCILGLRGHALGVLLAATGLIIAYRILRCASKASLSPLNHRFRLPPLNDSIARHLSTVASFFWLFCLLAAASASVVVYSQHSEEFGVLIWKLFLLGGFMFVLWAVSHQSLLFRLLPRGEGAWVKTTNWLLLATVYPAFLAISTLWWTAVIFRFNILSYYLLEVLVKTLAGFGLAYLAYSVLMMRIGEFIEQRRIRLGDTSSGSSKAYSPPDAGKYRIWTQYGVAILAVVSIYFYWNRTIGELGRSEAAPEPIKIVVAKAGAMFGTADEKFFGPIDEETGERISDGLPWRIVLGLCVVAFAWLVSRVTRWIMNRFVFAKADLEPGSRATVLTFLTYLLIGGGIMWGLAKAGVDSGSLKVVSGAFVFGITFGLQDIFRNFISGILLHLSRPIRSGDFVEIGGRRGTVTRIGARSTTIVGEDNIAVAVPNGSIARGNVINWSHPIPVSKISVPMQVTRDSPVETVKSVLLNVAGGHPLVRAVPAPEVSFQTLSAGVKAFELMVWIDAVAESRRITSDLLFSIESALKAQNIK